MKSENKLQQNRNLRKRADLVKLLFYKNENFSFLSDRENEIMRMVHWDELSFKDISKKLNISEQRVSQISKKAEQRFRKNIFESLNNYAEYHLYVLEKSKEINQLESENRILKEIITKNLNKIDLDVEEKIKIHELEVMGMELIDMDFSNRAINGLRSNFHNLRTVADLFQLSDSDLMKCRNFGVKSLNEVYSLFHKHGIDFKTKKLFH